MRSGSCLVRMGTCVAALALVGAAPLGADRSPAVTITVTDYSLTPQTDLIEAQHVVADVFATAGVRIMWREAAAPPPLSVDPSQVSVLILSRGMADQKCERERIPSTALASAAPNPVQRAWIFYDRVRDAAIDQRGSTGRALGYVIAHEVAHMLGEIAHAEQGIMEPALQLRRPLAEGFTREQGERLRATLERGQQPVALMTRRR